MKLPYLIYRQTDTLLREAWSMLNKAADVQDSGKSLLCLQKVLTNLDFVARVLHKDTAPCASRREIVFFLAQRYRYKLIGNEDTPATLGKLMDCIDRSAARIEGSMPRDEGVLPDVIIINEGIHALWRIIRGLRHALRKMRPASEYLRLFYRVSSIVIAAWFVYQFIIFALPWGAFVVYYHGKDFRRPVGLGAEFSMFKDYSGKRPVIFAHRCNWAARWHGCIRVPKDGSYAFYMQCGGGARLWVDGKLLIDNWNGCEWFTSGREVNIDLSRGAHRLKVDFFDREGNGALRLRWTGCGIPPNTVVGLPYLYKY